MKWDDYGEFIKVEDYFQHQIEFPSEIKQVDKRENLSSNNESSNLASNIESLKLLHFDLLKTPLLVTETEAIVKWF